MGWHISCLLRIRVDGLSSRATDNVENFGAYAQIDTNVVGARVTNCNIDVRARGGCVALTDSLVWTNPLKNISPFRDGSRTAFNANVAGGSDIAQYFVAGDFQNELGVLAPNYLKKNNLRANVHGQLRPNLSLSLNSGYVSSRLGIPQNDNNVFGAISGGLLGKAFDCSTKLPRDASCGTDKLSRGYRIANTPSPAFYADKIHQDVEHFLGSSTATWQPAGWLSIVGVGGYDVLDRLDSELMPPNTIFYSSTLADGYRQANRALVRSYTGNGTGTATFQLTDNLRSVTTAGVQWNREIYARTDAYGQRLLGGTGSLNGASALFSVGESNSDVVLFGHLVQQALEWRDKLFLRAAVRQDKSSNFGATAGYIRYPSASLSWVVGEEPFFRKTWVLNSLRLRTSYGEAGQRPDFRQAETYYSPVAFAVNGSDVPAITIGGTGNANLKAERTREREFGFDAGMFGDRVNFEFTYYNKTTTDALIGRRLAPSIGATTTQLVNLGKVQNRGVEYLIDGKLLDTRNLRATLTLNASVNDNKVVSLGNSITPIIFGLGGDTQRHQNGYPLGAYFARRIVSYRDINGDGMISRVNCPTYGSTSNPKVAGGPECEVVLSDSAMYLGNPLGRTEISITPAVTLFQNLRVQALFGHRGGVALNNSTAYFRCNVSPNQCYDVQSTKASLFEQARAVSTFMGTRGAYIENADFWKLRELSFTLTAPKRFSSQLHARGASITVAGRNLKTWTKYSGIDPELNYAGGANYSTAEFLTQPPVRYWTTRLNLAF